MLASSADDGVDVGLGWTDGMAPLRMARRWSGLAASGMEGWCALLSTSLRHIPNKIWVAPVICGVIITLAFGALWRLLWCFGAFERTM